MTAQSEAAATAEPCTAASGPPDFANVKEHELALLQAHGEPLVGLALSGGGIRSATFNLGVLQGLSARRLLSRAHYLSTVSGGGYIGSWLSSWVYRERVRAAENLKGDSPTPIERVEQQLGDDKLGHLHQVAWLRAYSNYLTPRLGLLSADTLQGVVTYARNMLLSLFPLLAALAVAVLVPLTLMRAHPERVSPWMLSTASVALFLLGNYFVHRNLDARSFTGLARAPFWARPSGVFLLAAVPLALSALLFALWLTTPVAIEARADWWLYAVAAALLLLPAWLFARRASKLPPPTTFAVYLLGLVVAVLTVSAGALALHAWFRALPQGQVAWVIPVIGVPAMLLLYLLAVMMHIGITGRGFQETVREWWARFGGLLIGVSLAWLLFVGGPVFGPFLVIWAGALVASVGGLTWLVTTAAGVLFGASPLTGAKSGRGFLERFTVLVPYVFIAGLLVIAALGSVYGMAAIRGVEPLTFADCSQLGMSECWSQYTGFLEAVFAGPLPGVAIAVAAVLALLLAWRVDINLFSFHMFYRNRLVRCYLGAANSERNEQPFINFDDGDSPPLHALTQRPYHIVNTALNLTRVSNLAWQERQAAACFLSPLYCGFYLAGAAGDGGNTDGGDPGRGYYARTDDYVKTKGRPLSLGAAMSISGAAASPNSGYHTSKAVAFLMTVFNVRLGWWLQNPARPEVWRKPGPYFGGRLLLMELLSSTDEKSRYVYLSDGGHFDNLGLYELVRRRCRYIVASDASMDGSFTFEDLGNAVRKCQIDLGVRIEIDVTGIRPDPATGKSLFHCAVGVIHYEASPGGGEPGFLLYLKPSLNGNEPADVAQYRAAHQAFPHEPTTDQWFSESQFESYRRLGQHIATTVFEEAAPGTTIQDLFMRLQHRWSPPSPRTREAFSRHTKGLHGILDRLRSDPDLKFLDAQIWPEWEQLTTRPTPPGRKADLWLPREPERLRAGFYLCTSMLELMENVYLDLNLEEEYDHPDNRGWINLFRHWSWSAMFRVTYAVVASTLGARFLHFCMRRLELGPGTVTVERYPGPGIPVDAFLQEAAEQRTLNHVEMDKIAQVRAQGKPFDEVLLLRLCVSDPSHTARTAACGGPGLIFTFGFALCQAHGIVYLRVQDHVRKMGLARQAIRVLREQGYGQLAADPMTGEDDVRFRRLLSLS